MRKLSSIECVAANCTNLAVVTINDDLLCKHCAHSSLPSPEQALKDIAAQLVPMGARAGSVYQELLSLGYLVPIEDCKAEVERLLAE